MHKLTKALHKQFGSDHSSSPSPLTNIPPLSGPASAEQEFYRFRKQRGVNLGSWFVLERWISGSPFRYAKSPGQSDLDVAHGDNAKTTLEHHWDNWIVEADWLWIRDRGINTVRLPIGYYHLVGIDPSVLKKTDFDGLQHVFEGAWSRIKTAIETAHRHGLGVLIDLHAAPGAQNNDSHSGTSNKPNFLTSVNMSHTIHVLRTLLQSISSHQNIVGIELLNEPQPGDQGHEKLKDHYTKIIQDLRSCDPRIPIYISDCWCTDDYAGYISALSPPQAITGLDHHLYRCFTAEDIHMPISQHSNSLRDPNATTPQLFARVSSKLAGCSSAIVVGEWSGAVNPGSIHGLDQQAETNARREYVDAQLALYEQHCAGWFFWTYKKEDGGDRGWSMRDAVGGGVFPDFIGMKTRINHGFDDRERINRRDSAKDKALGEHTNYWSQYPGDYQHWRFEEGFLRGWDDAYAFFASGLSENQSSVPELGFKGAWIKKRTDEHIEQKGGGKSVWEFEHALNQSLEAARKDFQSVYC